MSTTSVHIVRPPSLTGHPMRARMRGDGLCALTRAIQTYDLCGQYLPTLFLRCAQVLFQAVEMAPSSVRRDSALSAAHTIVHQIPHHSSYYSAIGAGFR